MAGRLRWAIILVASMVAPVADLPSAGAAESVQTAPAPAFVDVQLVLRETEAAKALRSKIEAEQFSYQSELAKRENALRSASEELATERDDLSEAEYIRRRQEIDQEVAELRRESQARKRQLEQAYNAGMDKLRTTMLRVVADIAKERNFALVLNKAAVVLGAADLDLTEEVINRINALLPTVDDEGVH